MTAVRTSLQTSLGQTGLAQTRLSRTSGPRYASPVRAEHTFAGLNRAAL